MQIHVCRAVEAPCPGGLGLVLGASPATLFGFADPASVRPADAGTAHLIQVKRRSGLRYSSRLWT